MGNKKVIIIGGGPAAYAAAIYLSRARIETTIFAGEQAGGQLMYTTEVENYPGFKDGIMGPALMLTMREQAERFGTVIKNENVTKVDLTGEIKKVWIGDPTLPTATLGASAVIVSTGAKSRMLGIGEEKLLGRGVSTCAVCDAAFFKGKTVAVLGGGDAAMEDLMALKKFAKKVYLIHRREELRASKIMQEKALESVEKILGVEIVEVMGETKLEKIKLSDGREMALDGLFLAIGHLPSTELFTDQLELDEQGYLVIKMTKSGVDNKREWLEGFPTQTSVRGVFGAGDVADIRYKQAATAAGMGVMAALDAEKFLTQ